MVGAGDWRLWRRLRQAAPANAPGAFCSTLAQWSGDGDTEQRWRDRLDGVALNVVLTLAGEPVGMVSATAPGADGPVTDRPVELIGLSWAADAHPGHPVVLSVKADNPPARRLYERHGFIEVDGSPVASDERLLRR
ncbi:MAG: GNAT family N-acetyltransferase [Actinomycetota bacterium]